MDRRQAATEMYALLGSHERPVRDHVWPRVLLAVYRRVASRAAHVPTVSAECFSAACAAVARLRMPLGSSPDNHHQMEGAFDGAKTCMPAMSARQDPTDRWRLHLHATCCPKRTQLHRLPCRAKRTHQASTRKRHLRSQKSTSTALLAMRETRSGGAHNLTSSRCVWTCSNKTT
jgi:hypothetical protein